MTDLSDFLLAQHEAPEDDEERERWRIEHDNVAEWALRKMAAAVAELDRLKAQAEEQRRLLDEWLADVRKAPERDAAFFEAKLTEYLRRLRDEGKAGKTYKLPAGSITSRVTPARVEVTDADAFKDWAEANARLDLLRITVEPNKTAIKETITKDGESVPGVEIIPGEERFTAKPETAA